MGRKRKEETAEEETVEKVEEAAAVEKPTAGPSRLEALLNSDTMKSMRKRFGDMGQLAADAHFGKVHRIPSGILPLDIALDGGYQVGRFSTNFGQKSSCKTTAYLKTIANAQRMCARCWEFEDVCKCKEGVRKAACAWLDVEGTFDNDWAALHGVDLKNLLLPPVTYAEQSLDILDGLVRSQLCDIIVLDSLAFLSPTREIEESVDKDLMGVQARLIGKAIRKVNAGIIDVGVKTGSRPTVLFTNQLRQKIGVMFGSPDTTSGGMAPGFAATVEVKFREGKYDTIDTEGAIKRAIAGNYAFRVEKSKSNVPRAEGEFKMLLADTETKKKGDIADEPFILSEVKRLGLLEGRSLLGEHFANQDELVRRLEEDKSFKSRVVASLWKIWAPSHNG